MCISTKKLCFSDIRQIYSKCDNSAKVCGNSHYWSLIRLISVVFSCCLVHPSIQKLISQKCCLKLLNTFTDIQQKLSLWKDYIVIKNMGFLLNIWTGLLKYFSAFYIDRFNNFSVQNFLSVISFFNQLG